MAPIRRDVYLYNEATGWLLTSAGLNGRTPGSIAFGGKAWKAAVTDGSLLPMSLEQDDPLVVRVVVDAALTPEEQAEWVAQLTWKLAVPDGRLVLASGTEYVEEGVLGEFAREVEVPAGSYRVEVYTQLPGINGAAALAKAGTRKAGLRKFWDATRSGEPRPAWLDADEGAAEQPSATGGTRETWRSPPPPAQPEAPAAPALVDVVVHLSPLGDTLDPPPLKGGWFSFGTARKPERCPRGLLAQALERETPRPQPAPASLVKTVDVHGRVADCELVALAGGALELPVRDAGLFYLLAYLCQRDVIAELRVDLGGESFDVAWPPISAGVHATPTDTGFVVHFEGELEAKQNIRNALLLGPLLERLPAGAVLELSSVKDYLPPGKPRPIEGRLRARGEVREGVWKIGEHFPKLAAAQLAEALELAAQAADLGPFTFRDAAELAGTVATLKALHPSFDDTSLTTTGLTVKVEGMFESLHLAEALMRQRLADVYPLAAYEVFDFNTLFR